MIQAIGYPGIIAYATEAANRQLLVGYAEGKLARTAMPDANNGRGPASIVDLSPDAIAAIRLP